MHGCITSTPLNIRVESIKALNDTLQMNSGNLPGLMTYLGIDRATPLAEFADKIGYCLAHEQDRRLIASEFSSVERRLNYQRELAITDPISNMIGNPDVKRLVEFFQNQLDRAHAGTQLSPVSPSESRNQSDTDQRFGDNVRPFAALKLPIGIL